MAAFVNQIQTMLAFQKKIQKPVLDILRPLFSSFKINFFAHERIFNDASKAFIISNVDVAKFWFQENYPIDVVLEPGCYLGEKLDNVFPIEQQEALSKRFNIAHTLFIVSKYPNYTDAFMLATSTENYHIIHSYLTYIDKIKNFISYYLLSSRKLFQQAEKNKINMINIPAVELPLNFIPANPLSDTAGGAYFINDKIGFISLTKRELACIAWLIKGKSASEIGLLLNISKRTVETYTEKIKMKLQCTKITELAYLIGKSNIDFRQSEIGVLV